MLKRKRNKGKTRVQYKLMKYKKMGEYEILEEISANVTLVQLMDSLGNVNHAISVVGSWIFESNNERALVLNKSSLDMICAHMLVKNKLLNLTKFIMLSDTY